MNSSPISFQVAGLHLHFLACDSSITFKIPHFYDNFLKYKENNKAQLNSIGYDYDFPKHELILEVHNGKIQNDKLIECLFTSNHWALWRSNLNRLIFIDELQSPITKALIEPSFRNGKIFRDVDASNEIPFYPLQNLDIQLFSNWLAIYGDIILHASGVITKNNSGYCFAGGSGAGKSTLAKSLTSRHSLQVLGEDNLILRYLDGQFFVFGTPWHEDPVMSFPQGCLLKKFFILDREANPGIHPIKPLKIVAYLMKTAFIPYYRHDLLPGILERLSHLAEMVPFYTLNYELGCDMWESIQEV